MSGKLERNFFRFNFCLSFLIFILYWGIIFSNKEAIIPKDVVIPPLLDFLIHGGNFLVNFIAHLMVNEHIEDNLLISWKFFFLLSIFYATFYKIIYFIFDYSVYPLVAVMDFKIYLLLIIIATILFLIGEYLFLKSLSLRNKLK